VLRGLNGDSLRSPKVTIVNADAFAWLEQHDEMFDAIVVDFPDPTNFSIGKLYSLSFYRQLKSALNDDGIVVIQSTSPLAVNSSSSTGDGPSNSRAGSATAALRCAGSSSSISPTRGSSGFRWRTTTAARRRSCPRPGS